MSEYIDERIVSIKFDNSGFAEGVSETQKSLDNLNKSLQFDGANEGGKALANTFKDISTEAKKTDLSPIGNAVEHIGEKFSALKTIATGAFLKIGADAVEMGKKLIKSVSIDPIAQGFDKYQSILTSQMTLTAALGGKTEEEIANNEARIKEVLDELAWYADETSYSLDDMIKNVSQFANYGIDLENAKTAMMGIANASAKSGAPLAMASHAMEGFSKAMGQGYMSYQVWRTWLNSSKITTLDFKQTMIDTAKAFAKESGRIGNAAYENGKLLVDMGKSMGIVEVTAENLESTLTKGRWLTTDVMLAALSKYSASMDDLYEATDHGAKAVSELFENSEAGFDKFSTEAFKYAQQCKTLNDVIEALFDATSTTWYRIFQSLIGDYKQTVEMWSDFAEYLFEWFVYPLQEVAGMIKEFAESNSNIIDETTGKVMTMREVIVDSFMNIMEAISSVINPIKEAFNAVFNPLETMPEKLQNGVEKFHAFTESLILTKAEAERLRDRFIAFFTVLQNIWNVFKSIGNIIKKYVFPVIKTVAGFAIKIATSILKVFIKIISAISSFVSRVFGVRDIVADIKEDILAAAESIDTMTDAAEDNEDALDSLSDTYTSHKDLLQEYIDMAGGAAEAVDELTEAEEKNAKSKAKSKAKAKEKDYTIPGGYTGESYLSYYQAIEKANNKTLAEFIKKHKITEDQYTTLIKMMEQQDKTHNVLLTDIEKQTGLNEDTLWDLMGIIHQTTVAYKDSDVAISHILNKDKEAAKWETIWDGINEAQKETLITYGDQETALQMYFKQGIKDYAKIADAIGLEEWKVIRVISAYEEAYKIEELLAKKKQEVNADTIDAARQELGYIKRKNEEKKKEQKLTERDKSIAERNARIAERNKKVQTSANKTTSKSVQVISSAIKQIPIIGTAFTALGKVFGSTSKATENSSKSVNTSLHSVRDYIDEVSNNKFVTTKDNFYKVKKSADDVTKSVKEIADETSKSDKKIKDSTNSMADNYKKVADAAEDAMKKSEEANKENKKQSQGSKKSNDKKEGSLADQVNKLFGEDTDDPTKPIKDSVYEALEWFKEKALLAFTYIKDKAIEKATEIKDKIYAKIQELRQKTIQEVFSPITDKIKEIRRIMKLVFKNIKKDMKGFFDAPLQTLSKALEEIKAGFSLIFSSDKQGVGGTIDILDEKSKNRFIASIDELINRAWEKIKAFFKSRVDAARNDPDNPFNGLVHMMDNLIDWWDDFTYDINKYLGRIKEAIHVVFGEGSLFDKLSNGSLWRPFLDLVVNTVDKFDSLQKNISKLKDSLTTGLKDAFKSLDEESKTTFDNMINSINSAVNYVKNFWENVKNAKEIIAGGGGSDLDAEAPGGLVGFVAKLSAKWDEFKEKLNKGLDWTTIIKIQELESILERIIKAVANAWIKIGLAKMAIDVGNFFKSIGDGLENLTKPLNKNKDLGKTLLEIAAAVAILAASFYSLGQMNSTSIEAASKAIKTLATVLGILFSVVSGFTRVFQMSTKFGKAMSIPQALGNGLESFFGQKNTMKQAAALILGISAGIYLLAEAFVVLAKNLKDIDPDTIKETEKVLAILAGIMVGAIIAIRLFVGKIGQGKGGLAVGGIDIKNQTIQKTISPIAETLKGFAVALGALIVGFVAVSMVIDKYLTNTDGSMDWKEFAAVTGVLAGMVAAVIAMMIVTSHQAKKLQGYDPKALKVFESILKPFIIGMATLIYGFQTLTKTIDNLERPKTFKHATILLFSMIAAVAVLMFVVVALAKWMTGEKSSDFTSMTKGLGISGDGETAGMGGFAKVISKSKTKTTKGDVAEAVKSISAVAVSLGFGIKMIASAFGSIVSAIDEIKDDKTFGRSIGIFIGMIAGMAILIGELGFIATKIPIGAGETFKGMALLIVSIGGSILLMSKGVIKIAESFSKIIKSGKEGTKAVDKALITIGVFLGAIVILFGLLAALSATGVGAAALGIGAAVLVAIATAILEIAAAVYVFAKGLEILVNTLIKVASANKEIEAGLDALILLMPKVKELIKETIKALVEGFVLGLAESKTNIAIALMDMLTTILEKLAEYLPRIRKALVKMKPEVEKIFQLIREFLTKQITLFFKENVKRAKVYAQYLIDLFVGILKTLTANLPTITKAIGDFLYALAESIVDMFYTEGRIFVKLLEIVPAIVSGIIDEFRNRFGLTKGGKPIKDKNDPNSVYSLGSNLVKGILEAIADWAKNTSLAKTITALWDAIKAVFTGKKASDQHSPSRATYKWGINIGKGLVNGINDSGKAVAKSSEGMWTAFSEPMMSEMDSFAAVTSSMLSQLLNADMDVNPTITPVFDMSNWDAAKKEMTSEQIKIRGENEFSEEQQIKMNAAALGLVATQQVRSTLLAHKAYENVETYEKVKAMMDQLAQKALERVKESAETPTTNYNYTQNNYSPKALSEIEIYRRTNDQLNFRKFVGG